mmetsp:Transcript_2255/g.3824  ORF Transcript_2255/g.3824 Transcript_2255/m.3824 type:complete len:368 (+) Transcript_2255:120-1223(+)
MASGATEDDECDPFGGLANDELASALLENDTDGNHSEEDWDPFGGLTVEEIGEGLESSDTEDEDDDQLERLGTTTRKQNTIPRDASTLISSPESAVPRVALDEISPETFRKMFLLARRPVVLVDRRATCVPMHITTEYLQKHHGSREIPLGFGGPSQQKAVLSDFLAFDDEALKGQYLRNLQMEHWFPDEAKHLKLPAVLGPNLLADEMRTPHVSATWRNWFELFVCSHHCAGFPFLHQDTCHVHAIGMQIQGCKRYIMFPPEDSRFLYTQPPGHTRSDIRDLDDVDPSKYPQFQNANRIHVDLYPGEILFCPADWWHTTKCMSMDTPSVTLNASFVDEGNYEAFLDSFCEFQAMKTLVKHGASVIR